MSSPSAVGLGVLLFVCSLVLCAIGLGVGSTGLQSVWDMWADPVASQIVFDIRAPRSLGAWAAGALLPRRAVGPKGLRHPHTGGAGHHGGAGPRVVCGHR